MLISALSANAADMKFFKKAAEKVWDSDPELFNPKRAVPDSLAEKHSAVILARHVVLNANYEQSLNGMSDKTFTKRNFLIHRMVKILDQNGVEEFSKHEFGETMRQKVLYYTYMKSDNAFGARIHKADGSIVDVDLSQAFAITDGKKDNEKNALKRKIDIPGLEPGDVLEYFVYDEDWVQELDPNPVKIEILEDYPVLESVIEGNFSPRLTVEYHSYNDAPAFTDSVAPNGNNVISLRMSNIPVLTDKSLLAPSRELPFYLFYTLNNESPYRRYPHSSRRGGIYCNLPAGSIYRDISFVLCETDYKMIALPGTIKKAVKNYRAKNPEATREDILNLAWTEAVYQNRFNKKEQFSDYMLAVIFSDLARKEC